MTGTLTPSQSFGDPSDHRCCEQHRDWPTLAQHLLNDFPDASINQIIRQLTMARAAVDGMALDEADALATAEQITRNQLALLGDCTARSNRGGHHRGLK